MMLSRNKDWIVKSSYWRNINRVLQRMGGPFENSIEINISPINNTDVEFVQLAEARIRFHGTREKPENFTHVFPDSLETVLCRYLGKQIADVILHEDLLSQIDSLKHKEMRRVWVWGGGVPFVLIARDPHRYPELIQYWIDHPPGKTQEPLFLGLFREHEERMKNPTMDEVPRKWIEDYANMLSRYNRWADEAKVRNFLEATPERLIGFPKHPIIPPAG